MKLIPMICTVCNTLEPIQMMMNTTQCQHCGGRMEFTQQHGRFLTEEDFIHRQQENHSPIEQHDDEIINIADFTGETYDDDPDVGF